MVERVGRIYSEVAFEVGGESGCFWEMGLRGDCISLERAILAGLIKRLRLRWVAVSGRC